MSEKGRYEIARAIKKKGELREKHRGGREERRERTRTRQQDDRGATNDFHSTSSLRRLL